MPGMDGAALIRALRTVNYAVRIIATSGLMSTQHGPNADLDITHFVPKPSTATALFAAFDACPNETA